MNIFDVHWIHLFLRVTDKRIILVSILLIISFTSRIGATRFEEHAQQWVLIGNDPNLKVTTIDTANMAPDIDYTLEYDRGTDMKTVEHRVSHSYSGSVDKEGGCRNVRGIFLLL
jgi:hypothetical protein